MRINVERLLARWDFQPLMVTVSVYRLPQRGLPPATSWRVNHGQWRVTKDGVRYPLFLTSVPLRGWSREAADSGFSRGLQLQGAARGRSMDAMVRNPASILADTVVSKRGVTLCTGKRGRT